MVKTQVKICGLTQTDDVVCAINAGASFLGFVFFAKSPRNVNFEQIPQLKKTLTNNVASVAVTVDPNDSLISTITTQLNPDYIQLHGNESLYRVVEIREKFKVKIIKAFAIDEGFDFAQLKAYEDVVDFFLFDSADKSQGYHGGSGRSFNWELLKDLKLQKPWFLSGGIDISNIANAIAVSGASFIDVSSGVESSRGQKSQTKIRELFKLLETAE